MPPSTNQNIIASGGPPRKKKKLVIVVIAVVFVIAAVSAGGYYWWGEYKKAQDRLLTKHTSDELQAQIKYDREQLYRVPAYDGSAQQQFLNLSSKSITAKSTEDWAQLETFSKQALQIKGYENDINTLTRLALAYEKQNKTSERRETLVILKKAYESTGRTDTDEYKILIKEVN